MPPAPWRPTTRAVFVFIALVDTATILSRSEGVLGGRLSSIGSRTSCSTRSKRTKTLWMPTLSGRLDVVCS